MRKISDILWIISIIASFKIIQEITIIKSILVILIITIVFTIINYIFNLK